MAIDMKAIPHHMARAALLRMSQSEALRVWMGRSRLARRAVVRFVPGERLEDAVGAAEEMANAGIESLITLLGEDVHGGDEAQATFRHYLEAVAAIAAKSLPAHISVKLTQLGLGVDDAVMHRALDALASALAEEARVLWIDMESSHWTDATLATYRWVRERHENVGVALQAYLHRTPADLIDLLPLRPRIRLVKGAYAEPASIAFQSPADVAGAYRQLALRLLDETALGGTPPTLATHDIDLLASIVERGHAPKASFEVAMLYGIRTDELRRLAGEGYRTCVLISYGSQWAPYFMRRLAERPANLAFGLRAMFGR